MAGEGISEHEILEIIREWKWFWMNQTQNNEQDRQNYYARSHGIDANMMHHLASLLHKKIAPPAPSEREARALRFAAGMISGIDGFRDKHPEEVFAWIMAEADRAYDSAGGGK